MALTVTKPTVGGSEDSWGTTINNALDDVVLEINSNADGTNVITPNLTQGSWQIGGTAVTSTAAELNILDGASLTTDELNILDGVTATSIELNILDGATVTTAELNTLDGVTATAAEINLLDGRTSIPSTLTDLGISDGSNGQFLTTNGSGGFSFATVTQGSGGIQLTDISVGTEGAASGNGSLSYNNSTGVFTYTPPTASGLGALTAHPNISAASDSNNSGNTFIQDILVDSNGHVTTIRTGTASTSYTQPTTLGGVGTYAWLGSTTGSQGLLAGTTYAASTFNLVYAGFASTTVFNDDTAATIQGTAPSGSWKAMGNAGSQTAGYANREHSTLFLRVS